MTDQRNRTLDDTSTQPLPAARSADLAKTATRGELIVYDLRAHHIHHLNATAAAVWGRCDGRRTLLELTREAGHELGEEVDVATVRIALTKLEAAALLDRPLPERIRLDLPTRRTFLRRVAASGMIAAPVIASMTAPAAAQMWSPSDQGCKGELEPCQTLDDCCVKGSSCVESVDGHYYGQTVCHLVDVKICKEVDQLCSSDADCCPPDRECTNVVNRQTQDDYVCRPIVMCKAQNREICRETSDCCDPTSICTDNYDGPGWHADWLCIPQ